MGGGKGGGSSQTVGYRYYMSVQMGLCRGPIDEIVQINVGDIRAWPIPDGDSETESGMALIAEGPNDKGVALYEDGKSEIVDKSKINTVRGTVLTSVNAPNLFGGDKKEGGVEGSMWVYMGSRTQVYATSIKKMLGGLVPDFRGVTTIFFDGLISALNPYPKAWKIRVRRVLSGWDGPVWHPELAVIWLRDGTIKAMNPAHIIYECLSNRDWGRGFDRLVLDSEGGFLEVAQTLYDEKLGLCMRWNRQDELGNFIQEVIDHIGGSMYIDRQLGKITMSLLRGDYDPETVPLFTYDSGLVSIEDDETNSRDDIVNETIVNWYDPIKNEDRQSRLHNLASMQSTGAIKSTTVTYDGVPTSDLSLRIGQRDLKASATALKRYKVILDRRAANMIPGSVFRISATDKNIFNVVLRAGKVVEGKLPDGQVTVEAIIDVFGLPAASFISGQETQWTLPDRTAVVIANRIVREATYREAVQNISPADLAILNPQSGTIAVVAAKPTTLSLTYGINTRTGSEEFVRRNNGSFVPVAYISEGIGLYNTIIFFERAAELGIVEIGTMVQIDDEMFRLDDIQTSDGDSGYIVVARACVDTLPAVHNIGACIYFADDDFSSDNREYSNGEIVDVKLTTVTSTQELVPALAEIDSLMITGRQGRPWAPSNLQINSVPYGQISSLTGDFAFTWSHRDRTIIQDQLIDYTNPSVGPEPGTTYSIRVYRAASDTTPVRTVTGINAASWTYTVAMRNADAVGNFAVYELEAVRAGITSQFKYRFGVNYLPTPSALASFTASGTAPVTLSAATPANANTASVQFYRTVQGATLNTNTDQLGAPVAAGSSTTATMTDTPATGSWDYYARPISSAGINGPISGPVNVVIS